MLRRTIPRCAPTSHPQPHVPEGSLNETLSSLSHVSAIPSPRRAKKFSRTGAILAGSAAALAAAAIWNVHRARKVEREHPPAGRFVTVDGVRLHYIEKGGEGGGGKPPVVLIHGNVVMSEDFALSGVLNKVAGQGRRVIAFDRPGYGYSDRPHGRLWTAQAQADLLRRACERLGVERPVIVGHSWGAIVALAFALNDPEAVSGLVLLSGYYYPTVRADLPLVSITAIPVLGDVLRYTLAPLIGAATLPLNFKAMFGPRSIPDRFSREFPHGMPVRPAQLRAETQDAATMVPAVMAMRGRFAELHMPVIIFAGDRDRIVDVGRHAERLHDEIPQSDLRLVPDAGHMVHYAVPGQVADAIEEVAAAGRPTAARRQPGDAAGAERRAPAAE
jgi:pimeloyl-ACP methyl ester carboxylesterase